MALLAAYLALFRDWRPYLRRGERAVVLLVAQDRLQAQILHRYIQGVLSAPLLFGKVLSTTANEIELKGGVVIEVVSRNYRSVRGRSVCVALLDEAAMWRAEDSSNPDVEVFNSIRASMATFGNDGMMVTASSPYSRRGILWEAHRNWYGVPLAWRTWRAVLTAAFGFGVRTPRRACRLGAHRRPHARPSRLCGLRLARRGNSRSRRPLLRQSLGKPRIPARGVDRKIGAHRRDRTRVRPLACSAHRGKRLSERL
jgi:hypothetical protein